MNVFCQAEVMYTHAHTQKKNLRLKRKKHTFIIYTQCTHILYIFNMGKITVIQIFIIFKWLVCDFQISEKCTNICLKELLDIVILAWRTIWEFSQLRLKKK